MCKPWMHFDRELKKIKSQKIGLFASSKNANRTTLSSLKNKPRTMVEALPLVQNRYKLNQFGFQCINYLWYLEKNKNIMHQCMKCDGLFPTKIGLITHKKMWCKYNYLCQQCGKIMKNQHGLLIHKRIIYYYRQIWAMKKN